jgi:ATP-dependent DNA helicase PIF1
MISVSMIDATLFDKLEQIARRVRQNSEPFGGLQLIVSGDFFQLPPVARPDGPGYKFAFQAESWDKVFPKENMSSLTRVFRQKENDFVRILEGMRKGLVRPDDLRVLARCNRKVKYEDGIEPVGL